MGCFGGLRGGLGLEKIMRVDLRCFEVNATLFHAGFAGFTMIFPILYSYEICKNYRLGGMVEMVEMVA